MGKKTIRRKSKRSFNKRFTLKSVANGVICNAIAKRCPRIGWVKPPFLTCGAAATTGSRCKYFQWIHPPLYPLPSDPMPDWLRKGQAYKPRPLKSFNKESPEWLQQAEQNVEKWKREHAWLNQFAESSRKQNERWEANKKAPVLPSTFHWSPEIAKIYKKTDAWKDLQAMANNELETCWVETAPGVRIIWAERILWKRTF